MFIKLKYDPAQGALNNISVKIRISNVRKLNYFSNSRETTKLFSQRAIIVYKATSSKQDAYLNFYFVTSDVPTTTYSIYNNV